MEHNEATCRECQANEQDCCAHCRADWKRPHYEECPMFHQCEYPPGCDKGSLPAHRLCLEHYQAVSALFAPAVSA